MVTFPVQNSSYIIEQNSSWCSRCSCDKSNVFSCLVLLGVAAAELHGPVPLVGFSSVGACEALKEAISLLYSAHRKEDEDIQRNEGTCTKELRR